jgi:hypothetical protein
MIVPISDHRLMRIFAEMFETFDNLQGTREST